MSPARLTSQRYGTLVAIVAGGFLAAVAGVSAAGNLSVRPADSAARPQAPQLVVARANDLKSSW